VKELVALKEHLEDRDSERSFARDFTALQTELGTFRATKVVPDKQGNQKYCYLPYEEIMARVQPLLTRFGFSLSFSTDFRDNRIVQTCTLQHAGGYHRDYTAFCRAGSGPPGCNESQADGSAQTYAKRYALCNCLNITVERDTDARNEGGEISAEQADTLRKMVMACGADEGRFLTFAGAFQYEDISAGRYSELLAMLRRKAAK
jgi:hypothetical protein